MIKSGDMFFKGVIARNNGATRVVGFIDFEEEVENWGTGIGDMEEGDVLD
jgi:hypothetical protein